MAKSQVSFNKKEKEKKRLKKRQDKLQKKEERKSNAKGDFDSMIAYVDEHGNISDTPPDPANKEKIKAENIEIGVPKREKDDTPSVFRGRLDYFNSSKGFGFIRQIDSQNRYFVHVNGMLEELKEGDIVVFELEKGLKGLNAIRVKKA